MACVGRLLVMPAVRQRHLCVIHTPLATRFAVPRVFGRNIRLACKGQLCLSANRVWGRDKIKGIPRKRRTRVWRRVSRGRLRRHVDGPFASPVAIHAAVASGEETNVSLLDDEVSRFVFQLKFVGESDG